jgi:hypothetical protein
VITTREPISNQRGSATVTAVFPPPQAKAQPSQPIETLTHKKARALTQKEGESPIVTPAGFEPALPP